MPEGMIMAAADKNDAACAFKTGCACGAAFRRGLRILKICAQSIQGVHKMIRKNIRRSAAAMLALSVLFTCGTGGGTSVFASETPKAAYLHSTYKTTDRDGIGSGNYLYHTLKITGDKMPEEQIFSVSDIESIYSAGISEAPKLGLSQTAQLNINGAVKKAEGIKLYSFLKMCGLSDDVSGSSSVQFFSENNKNGSKADLTIKLSEIKNADSGNIIAFAADGKPLDEKSGGPLMLCTKNGSTVKNLSVIRVSGADGTADPYYGLHLREPLKYMQQSAIFTVNYIDSSVYKETDDGAVPFAVKKYSMKEIEELIMENPNKVHGNYFGVSGNEKTKNTYGLGGFSDYYEGIDMGWFLSNEAGLQKTAGKAVFYGRNNDKFAEINDLTYFFSDNYENYYLEIDNDTYIKNVVPVIAVSKNGYPLLPEHDHEMEGNVNYNIFNDNAIAAGFNTKIGLVKNVSGPFIAGLANFDGIYGGYRNETSGDCIRIDIYVNKTDYTGITSKEADISIDENHSEKTLLQASVAKWAALASSLIMFK